MLNERFWNQPFLQTRFNQQPSWNLKTKMVSNLTPFPMDRTVGREILCGEKTTGETHFEDMVKPKGLRWNPGPHVGWHQFQTGFWCLILARLKCHDF